MKTKHIMKTNYTLPFILLAFLFFSCNTEEEIPGTGDGKLGFAFVLKGNNVNNSNLRIHNSNVRLEEGFIQIKELELSLEGRDENGSFEKETEIEFDDIKRITFNQFDESADFFINIPSADYTEIEVELDLIDYDNEPSILLRGFFTDSENNDVPLTFELYDEDIDFEVEIESDDDDQFFRVDNSNNPLALFELNAINWFSGISDLELENAVRTNGVILITDDINSDLFDKIEERIKDSAEIDIELKN